MKWAILLIMFSVLAFISVSVVEAAEEPCADFEEKLRTCTLEELGGLKRCKFGANPFIKGGRKPEAGETLVTIEGPVVISMYQKGYVEVPPCIDADRDIIVDVGMCEPVVFADCANPPIDICRVEGETMIPPICPPCDCPDCPPCPDCPTCPPCPPPTVKLVPPVVNTFGPWYFIVALMQTGGNDPGVAWFEEEVFVPEPEPIDPSVNVEVGPLRGICGGVGREFEGDFAIDGQVCLMDDPSVSVAFDLFPHFAEVHGLAIDHEGGPRLAYGLGGIPFPFSKRLGLRVSLMTIEEGESTVSWFENGDRVALRLTQKRATVLGAGIDARMTQRLNVFLQGLYMRSRTSVQLIDPPADTILSDFAVDSDSSALGATLGLRYKF